RVDFAASAMDEHQTQRRIGGCDPGERRDDGGQRRWIFDQLAAELDHDHAGGAHSSPLSSGRPTITLPFLTASRAAPLSRLSITETSTARPAPSTRQPMSQKFDPATCLISGSSAPLSLTIGAPAYAAAYASASISSVTPGFSRT